MSSVFSYKRPTASNPIENTSAFSYKRPTSTLEENAPSDSPRSFTQGVSQQLVESEELERDIDRGRARGTSRILERLGGLPGDVASLIQSLSGRETEKFPLPTSENLQKTSERLTGGYTKPKNEFEEKSDELLGDIASFMLPGAGGYSIARNLGIPVAANLAKEGIKYSGGSDKGANGAKIGTMVILDLLSNRKGLGLGGVKKYINELFGASKSSIPSGTLTPVQNLSTSLQTLENTLNVGGSSASKAPTLKKISELQGKISNGMLDPKEFAGFRTSINELISEMGGWEVKLPKPIKESAIRNLNHLKGEVIKAGEEYGKNQNPDFLKYWKSANEASAAYQQSNVIANFIEKHFGNKFKSLSTKALFGLGAGAPIAASFSVPGTAAASGVAGGLAAGYNTYKIAHRVWKSPVLRNYYSKVLKASAKGNVSQMTQNMKLLDKKLSDEESKEKEMIEKITSG